MAHSLFRCDATFKRGGGSCKHRASVQIVTVSGTVLNYCDKHGARVNDPEHKYHSGVSAVFTITE